MKQLALALLLVMSLSSLQVTSQEPKKVRTESTAADPCEVLEVDIPNYTFSKLDNVEIDLPEAVIPEKIQGVDTSYWRFTNSEIEVTLHFGTQTPTQNGYEIRRPAFTKKQDQIGGILASLWHYRDPDSKLQFVSAAKFYLDGTTEGQSVTIYLRSKCNRLFDLDEVIIRSFRRKVKATFVERIDGT